MRMMDWQLKNVLKSTIINKFTLFLTILFKKIKILKIIKNNKESFSRKIIFSNVKKVFWLELLRFLTGRENFKKQIIDDLFFN